MINIFSLNNCFFDYLILKKSETCFDLDFIKKEEFVPPFQKFIAFSEDIYGPLLSSVIQSINPHSQIYFFAILEFLV